MLAQGLAAKTVPEGISDTGDICLGSKVYIYTYEGEVL
jgi:hypothetical protein